MDKKIKTRQFANFLKSSMKSATPRVYLQEIADGVGMSPQYINQITNGKLLPPSETFDLIINVLQPRLQEDAMYRVINLYDEAKFGRSVTGQGKEDLSSSEILLLKLFNQLKPDQQVEAMGILDQYIEDNRTQMAHNAGLESTGYSPNDHSEHLYVTENTDNIPRKASGNKSARKKGGKSGNT